jgi:hypothetical protein
MFYNIPSKETNPHATQIIKHNPIDCVSRKTPFGETNIPEPKSKEQGLLTHGKSRYDKLPMIVPIRKQMPENKPRCLLSVISSVGAIAPNGSG